MPSRGRGASSRCALPSRSGRSGPTRGSRRSWCRRRFGAAADRDLAAGQVAVTVFGRFADSVTLALRHVGDVLDQLGEEGRRELAAVTGRPGSCRSTELAELASVTASFFESSPFGDHAAAELAGADRAVGELAGADRAVGDLRADHRAVAQLRAWSRAPFLSFGAVTAPLAMFFAFTGVLAQGRCRVGAAAERHEQRRRRTGRWRRIRCFFRCFNSFASLWGFRRC